MSAKNGRQNGLGGVALRLEGADGRVVLERHVDGFGSGAELLRCILAEQNAAAFREFCNTCAKITGADGVSGEDMQRIRQNLAARNAAG